MKPSRHTERSSDQITHSADLPRHVSAPRGAARQGQLTFVRGAALVTLAALAGSDDLFQADFEGPVPQVDTADGAVTIQYRRFPLIDWARYALLWGPLATSVRLNQALPWEIIVRGGVSRLSADLRELQLSGLQITGGASELTIDLPAPRGVVPIRISGGASKVTLRRPAKAAVRLSIKSGASRVAFDSQYYGAIGGPVRLATPDGAESADRYEIDVRGGASNLDVDTW
jgi:hypothetical protein